MLTYKRNLGAGPRMAGFGVMVFGLALGPAVGLGLGRFAYALLLPAMREDLGWSYVTAGAIATGNAVGYLAGAAVAPYLARSGARGAFIGGMFATAALLALSACTTSVWILLALRLLVGCAGAISVVVGMGLVVHVCRDLSRRQAGVALGTYWAGTGAGIAVAGIVLPPILAGGAMGDWRLGWLTLGLAACGAGGIATVLTRGAPRALGEAAGAKWSWKGLAPTFIAYACYGLGFMSFMTFVVSLLRVEHGAGSAQAFWIVLGIAAIGLSRTWAWPLSRLCGGAGPAATMAVLATGTALPLFSENIVVLLLSAVLCGMTFLAVASAVTVVTSGLAPAGKAMSAVSGLTVAFALGQCVGPAWTGLIADEFGDVRVGLGASTAALVVGTLVALRQREGKAG